MLYKGPLLIDPLDVEANELIKLLTFSVFSKFIEAYTEIATKHFYMPDLPDVTFIVSGVSAYGRTGSYGASRSSYLFSKNGLNGSAVEMNTKQVAPSIRNDYQNTKEQIKPEATLTGGGEGTALPPVEGTVKMIGIQKNKNEDLVIIKIY